MQKDFHYNPSRENNVLSYKVPHSTQLQFFEYYNKKITRL